MTSPGTVKAAHQDSHLKTKKRDPEQASLADITGNLKKQRAGSLDNLLDIDDDITDGSTASESECEDVNKVSRMQKIFAKKSIKREKRREKDHKKKVEKNMISMEDFLSKQSEFKMWLCEEKNKHAGDLSSPKLKSLFKQFVHMWNKRKLPAKYYKSTLASDASPLTKRRSNFMMGENIDSEALQSDPDVDNDREKPSSPFVTFGKTPPKMFKSKRLQLFGRKPDIALISVASIGSPSAPPKKLNKENVQTGNEVCQYQTPTKLECGPATPYKVSVYPWAVADGSGNQSLDVCSTSTPPNTSFEGLETEDWPPPPSEEEILGSASEKRASKARNKESPHIPPPPPPRIESLTPGNKHNSPSPVVSNSYADPYDKVTSDQLNKVVSDYQEPIDTVVRINDRTKSDNPRLILQSFSQNDEPDTSLYCKSVTNESLCQSTRCSKETVNAGTLLDLKAVASDFVQEFHPGNIDCPKSEYLENLYAKPVKQSAMNKVEQMNDIRVTHQTSSQSCTSKSIKTVHGSRQVKETESKLYDEIIAHYDSKSNNVSSMELNSKPMYRPDPIYETVDECCEKQKSQSDPEPLPLNGASTKVTTNSQSKAKSHLAKGKKTSILAASSDKIYEMYLSLKGNPNNLKSTVQDWKNMPDATITLNKKFNSQPDISVSEHSDSGMEVCQNAFKKQDNSAAENKTLNDRPIVWTNLAQRCRSLDNDLKEPECHGTPTIMATSSFESLYAVTPLSKRSSSTQSLPNKTGSLESLSYPESSMSVSSRSTLSVIPDENDLRLYESFEEDNAILTCISCEETTKNTIEKTEIESKCSGLDDNVRKEKFADGNIPVTPCKLSAAKHGIDLSVYILKPSVNSSTQNESCKDAGIAPSLEITKDDEEIFPDPGIKTSESRLTHKIIETQSKLTIKDNFSVAKPRTEISKASSKFEHDKGNSIQSVHECKANSSHTTSLLSAVPNIGISSKTHKAGVVSKQGQYKCKQHFRNEFSESDYKGPCAEVTKLKHDGDAVYLETDIDTVLAEKRRINLKKSKSHSNVDQVVTDIW